MRRNELGTAGSSECGSGERGYGDVTVRCVVQVQPDGVQTSWASSGAGAERGLQGGVGGGGGVKVEDRMTQT